MGLEPLSSSSPPPPPEWGGSKAPSPLRMMRCSKRPWPHAVVFALRDLKLGLLEADLVFQRQPPVLVDRPHGAADGSQGGNDAREEFPVVFLRRQLLFGQLGDLAHDGADLLPSLFDNLGIERLFRTQGRTDG